MITFMKQLLKKASVPAPDWAMDAEYEPFRGQLRQAGLSEKKLRKMKPDDRVKALEKAELDPYDYIYLAC